MDNSDKRNILLLVEGAKTEVKLFKHILKCFPEIKIDPDNIITYNTDIWALNDNLSNEFGDDWYLSEDIDFIEYLKALDDKVKNKKITDIYLVFDYERQDPRFNATIIENMMRFFNNSTENGQLFLNYPMIEAYRHYASLPDDDFFTRKCYCSELLKYKQVVNSESKYTNLSRISRHDFKQIIVHNLQKAAYMVNPECFLSSEEAWKYYTDINFQEILEIQNRCSEGEAGFVYVLCTCILFVSEYRIEMEDK